MVRHLRLAAQTCELQLTESVVNQRCVSGAGPRLLPLVLPPDLADQPAQGRRPVQDVAHQVPGDGADQVQSGGGQGSGQDRQAGLQAGQSRGVVPLQETRGGT